MLTFQVFQIVFLGKARCKETEGHSMYVYVITHYLTFKEIDQFRRVVELVQKNFRALYIDEASEKRLLFMRDIFMNGRVSGKMGGIILDILFN